jgi:hypothetical protein
MPAWHNSTTWPFRRFCPHSGDSRARPLPADRVGGQAGQDRLRPQLRRPPAGPPCHTPAARGAPRPPRPIAPIATPPRNTTRAGGSGPQIWVFAQPPGVAAASSGLARLWRLQGAACDDRFTSARGAPAPAASAAGGRWGAVAGGVARPRAAAAGEAHRLQPSRRRHCTPASNGTGGRAGGGRRSGGRRAAGGGRRAAGGGWRVAGGGGRRAVGGGRRAAGGGRRATNSSRGGGRLGLALQTPIR